MPIDVKCPGCQSHLRAPDTAAGETIRCPKCNQAMVVPVAGGSGIPASGGSGVQAPGASSIHPAAPSTTQTASSSNIHGPSPAVGLPDSWYVKTAAGQTYGPVPKSQLDGWIAEGRVNAECQVLQHGAPRWQWASDVYPQLAAASGATAGAPPAPSASLSASYQAAPGASQLGAAPAISVSPSGYATGTSGGQLSLKRHRGGLVLTLGILSLAFSLIGSPILCCCLVGPLQVVLVNLDVPPTLTVTVSALFIGLLGIGVGLPAWLMAQNDLRLMLRKKMDPTGRGLTRAGLWLGMLSVMLAVLSVITILVLMSFAESNLELNPALTN